MRARCRQTRDRSRNASECFSHSCKNRRNSTLFRAFRGTEIPRVRDASRRPAALSQVRVPDIAVFYARKIISVSTLSDFDVAVDAWPLDTSRARFERSGTDFRTLRATSVCASLKPHRLSNRRPLLPFFASPPPLLLELYASARRRRYSCVARLLRPLQHRRSKNAIRRDHRALWE